MALTMAVYTKRHFADDADEENWQGTLCRTAPATLGPRATTNPTQVSCVLCLKRLGKVGWSLNMLADGLRGLGGEEYIHGFGYRKAVR